MPRNTRRRPAKRSDIPRRLCAERYVNAIIAYCESLETFPLRGAQRDDIRPGLRITNYKGRTVIAFAVDAPQVSILGVFYGGQDYAMALQDDLDEER